MSDTPEFVKASRKLDRKPDYLTQLDAAEQSRESFRRSGNWQRYGEMCMECARIGRLLNLEEQQQRNEK